MNSPRSIPLGSKARDKVSGFSGIVVAITEKLYGARKVTIAPQQALMNHEPVPNHTFDEEQVALLVEDPKPTPSPSYMRHF